MDDPLPQTDKIDADESLNNSQGLSQERIDNHYQPAQTSEPKLLEKKGKTLLFAGLAIAVFLLGSLVGGYFIYQKYLPKDDLSQSSQATTSEVTDTTPTVLPETPSSEEITSQDYTIDLPDGLTVEDNGKNARIYMRTEDEVRNIYEEAKKTGCPGACSYLIEDDNLEKQFEILSKVASLTKCQINDELKEEIGNFKLFDGGPATKEITDLIWNENLGICGIKFIGHDGYDAWLGNYEYEVGFLSGDKVINIHFELFPMGVFPEVDSLWESFGMVDGACGGDCYQKQYEYMENLDLGSALITRIISTYDSSVKSFNLK